jgi:DsbC/DsbD-like thiol-disulfide interchange protein
MRRCLAILAIVLAAAVPAAAQGFRPMQGVTAVTLIEGWRRDDGSHVAAVEIRLAPGWHTYWRAPGMAGVPPRFDWSGSRNLAGVSYEWPRPQLFESFGTATIGYEGALVLPVVLTPHRPGGDIEAALDLSFGVCDEICVPAEARLSARLAAEGPAQGRLDILTALADRPLTGAEAGVSAVACRLVPAGGGMELTAEITFADAPEREQVAVLESGHPGLWIGAAETRVDGRTVVARAPAEGAAGGAVLDRSALRLTVLDEGRAVDIRGCHGPG